MGDASGPVGRGRKDFPGSLVWWEATSLATSSPCGDWEVKIVLFSVNESPYLYFAWANAAALL